jgi:predicted nuclease of predicted toxin-antitoxin system
MNLKRRSFKMKLTPINGNTETEGSEFIYRGNKLIIARSGNTNFKKLFRELMKPFQEEFDSGRMSEDQSNNLMIECVSQTILVGWKEITDVTGEKFEYSHANAKSLLTDDKDVYDSIIVFSENIDNYLTSSDEALKVK